MINSVARGHIYALGRHLLMCGDATCPLEVAKLFGTAAPTLVVCSPPYLDARDYDRPIPCWTTLMQRALGAHAYAPHVQMLINLGLRHQASEYVAYWDPWIAAMRAVGWRFYSQYVWNKQMAYPGRFGCRLNPAHEFDFHLHKHPVDANKWIACTQARTQKSYARKKDGSFQRCEGRTTNTHKTPSSVLNTPSVKFGEACGHPAQMPVELAAMLLRTWKKQGAVAYDPFCGSGTTLHACELEQVQGLGMEISQTYVQLALDRWHKEHPSQKVKRIA